MTCAVDVALIQVRPFTLMSPLLSSLSSSSWLLSTSRSLIASLYSYKIIFKSLPLVRTCIYILSLSYLHIAHRCIIYHIVLIILHLLKQIIQREHHYARILASSQHSVGLTSTWERNIGSKTLKPIIKCNAMLTSGAICKYSDIVAADDILYQVFRRSLVYILLEMDQKRLNDKRAVCISKVLKLPSME